MKIGGLQKVSTIDYPGEIACVVFLWGCNFRCGFCYNPGLVIENNEQKADFFSEDEVLDFLRSRKGKLDAVVISGGEPLISLDKNFVRKIKELGFLVKVDTNGSFPEKLREFVDEELIDYVAMDVKGAREDYGRIVGCEVDLRKIEESIKIVDDFGRQKAEGRRQSEFRTTVVPELHDLDSVRKMGEWMNGVLNRKPGKIFLQGFKVNKDGMIDDKFLERKNVLESELVKLKEGVLDLFEEVGIRV